MIFYKRKIKDIIYLRKTRFVFLYFYTFIDSTNLKLLIISLYSFIDLECPNILAVQRENSFSWRMNFIFFEKRKRFNNNKNHLEKM